MWWAVPTLHDSFLRNAVRLEAYVISRLLLESLWLLAVVLVAVQFALIVVWSWLRSRAAARAVWIGFAAIPALLILSTVVETPRERIIQVCRELADAVETVTQRPAGDIGVIGQHLAGSFEANGLDRTEVLDRAKAVFERYTIHDPRLRNFEVTLPQQDMGTATFNASCRVESQEGYYGYLPTRWRLRFRLLGDTWKVTRAEPIPIPPLNLRGLDEVLR